MTVVVSGYEPARKWSKRATIRIRVTWRPPVVHQGGELPELLGQRAVKRLAHGVAPGNSSAATRKSSIATLQ